MTTANPLSDTLPLSNGYVYDTSENDEDISNDVEDEDDLTSNSVSSVEDDDDDDGSSAGRTANAVSDIESSVVATQQQLPPLPLSVRPLDLPRQRSTSSTSPPRPQHALTPRPGVPELDDLSNHHDEHDRSINPLPRRKGQDGGREKFNVFLYDADDAADSVDDNESVESVFGQPPSYNDYDNDCYDNNYNYDYGNKQSTTMNFGNNGPNNNRPPVLLSRRTLPVAPLGSLRRQGQYNNNSGSRVSRDARRLSYTQAEADQMENGNHWIDDKNQQRLPSRTNQHPDQRRNANKYRRASGLGVGARGDRLESRASLPWKKGANNQIESSMSRSNQLPFQHHTSATRRRSRQWSGSSDGETFEQPKSGRRPHPAKFAKTASKGKESNLQSISVGSDWAVRPEERRHSRSSQLSADQHSNDQEYNKHISRNRQPSSSTHPSTVQRPQPMDVSKQQLQIRKEDRVVGDDDCSPSCDESSVDEEAWIVDAAIAIRQCGGRVASWGPIQWLGSKLMERFSWRRWRRKIIPSACRRRLKKLRFQSLTSSLSREDLGILFVGGFALFMIILHYRLVQTTWILEERLRMASLHPSNPSLPLFDPEVLAAAMSSQVTPSTQLDDLGEFDGQQPTQSVGASGGSILFTLFWFIISMIKLIIKVPFSLASFLLPMLWGILAGVVLYVARTFLFVGLICGVLYFALRHLLQHFSSIPLLKNASFPMPWFAIPSLNPSLLMPYLTPTMSTAEDSSPDAGTPTNTPRHDAQPETSSSPEGKRSRAARLKKSTSDLVKHKKYQRSRTTSTAIS